MLLKSIVNTEYMENCLLDIFMFYVFCFVKCMLISIILHFSLFILILEL